MNQHPRYAPQPVSRESAEELVREREFEYLQNKDAAFASNQIPDPKLKLIFESAVKWYEQRHPGFKYSKTETERGGR